MSYSKARHTADYRQEVDACLRGREIIAARAAQAGLTAQQYLDDRRVTRRAKKKAAAVGLSYWPAIAYGTSIDPTAYAVAEEILHARRPDVSPWGDMAFDPIQGEYYRSHGVWDSEGHYGVTPRDVARLWFKAGCRNGTKFHLSVAVLGDLGNPVAQRIRKAHSAQQVADLRRGARWLQRNGLDLDGQWWDSYSYRHRNVWSTKAIIAIGRLSSVSRWAAISELDIDEFSATRPVRVRDLNWQEVKACKGKFFLAYRRGVAPAGMWWWRTLPETARAVTLRGDSLPPVHGNVSPKVIKALVPAYTCEADLRSAVTLARLFGTDMQAIKRRVSQFPSLHDAGMVPLPDKAISSQWGTWLNSHPSAWSKTNMLDEVERIAGGLPSSTAEFDAAYDKALRANPDWWLLEQGVKNPRAYIKLFKQPHKDADFVPAPHVERDGYTLLQLKADDWRQPLAGLYTDCCQHLDNAAAACAKASWLRSDCAIWALLDDRDNIVAQSFVWRSKRTVVLDSVEAKSGYRKRWVADMFIDAARQAVGRMGIKRVYVGDTRYGLTNKVLRCIPDSASRGAPKPLLGKIGYTDARNVRVVAD